MSPSEVDHGLLESPLPRSFYARPAVEVAPELLNCILVRRTELGLLTGRIAETEAYMPGDEASHAYRGQTARNAAMFGPPGHAYVYYIYGAHYCLNAVTGAEGEGAAVLIRALEPLAGVEQMAGRRGMAGIQLSAFSSQLSAITEPRRDEAGRAPSHGPGGMSGSPAHSHKVERVRIARALCGGPGKLCQALGIDLALNGVDLTTGEQLWIAPLAAPAAPDEIVAGPRIGITRAAEHPWRFMLRSDPFTSRA